MSPIAVGVKSNDTACVVDARYNGAADTGEDIVEGGVKAAAVEEAVNTAGIALKAHDFSRVVDPERKGAVGGQGIVEGGDNTPHTGDGERAPA
jgi:hypothetical protein